MGATFDSEYKKLNKAQKEAVEALEGPVMVVAGPGTGKTQILALRIANILKKTDVKGNGILCLTFTNSAVGAMRERLVRYIGEAGEKVNIFTFHSFGMKIIEEYFAVLGFKEAPKLLDEIESAIFFDEILNVNGWEYLRPRSDTTRYFSDLRSLISLLKRERISKDEFKEEIEKEIKHLENSEESISTRGASKGELKAEVQKQIDGLTKAKEIAKFLELYEKTKHEKNMLDYDDVLEALVKIVETSEDALNDIRERYLYILVDEHQDSSRVQNEFLARTWSEIESPDIFVVGDDRQLIYGFSGASIDHFKGFKKTFRDAKLIPLLENYRSTQVILDAAHALLPSMMVGEKLRSQSKEHHPIKLIEAVTPEEEILAAAVEIKKKIKEGIKPEDCAILVPKNAQVRIVLEILHQEGLPVTIHEALGLFDQDEAKSLLRVLKIIDSGDVPSLALSFLDKFSGVTPIEAHKFLASQNMRELTFESLTNKPAQLFAGSTADKWLEKLLNWKKDASEVELKEFIIKISRELLENSRGLVSGENLAETLLGLLDKRPDTSLHDFVAYLERLEKYGEYIPVLAKLSSGVKVLTMHSSKGLEFDFVWIAHMDERSLSGGKKLSFTLPEVLSERIEERDIDAVKRKLFVAITRAKRFCTLSYATQSKKGRDQGLARIISELPEEVFKKEEISIGKKNKREEVNFNPLKKLVKETYANKYVSASLLNNFYECPWNWYFRNLIGLPEAEVETLEFGSAVHASIDRILNLSHVPEAGEIENIANEEILRKNLDERIKGRMANEVRKVLENWVEKRLPEIKTSRKTEESVSVNDKEFPHLKIYGKIDLIENLADKVVRVTDFKTGSARKKYDIEKLDDEGRMSGNLRQLAMYAYLLRENPKWAVYVRESRLEFLEAKSQKESIYDRVITSGEIALLKKDITDYDKLVKSGQWIERECRYNSYGKNTECEYCKMANVFSF